MLLPYLCALSASSLSRRITDGRLSWKGQMVTPPSLGPGGEPVTNVHNSDSPDVLGV